MILLTLLTPVLCLLSIRLRMIVGLPLLVAGLAGLAVIFGWGALAVLFVPAVVLALAGLLLVVSGLLRKPRPRRLGRVRGRVA